MLVPFGRRTATGVVVGPAGPQPNVRDALRLLDDGPLLNADVIELVRFAAAHYLSPLGPAIKAALPPGLDVREKLSARLTDQGTELLERGQLDLAGQEDATRRLLRKASSGARLRPAELAALSRRGLVTVARAAEEPRGAPEVEMAAAAPGAVPPVRAPKQAALVAWLLARAAPEPSPRSSAAEGDLRGPTNRAPRDPPGPPGSANTAARDAPAASPRGRVPVEELLAAFPGSRPQLRKLARDGLVLLSKAKAGASQLPDSPWGTSDHQATPSQAAALAALRGALDGGAYAPFLLDGVTGSGKTWVYLEAIAHARSQGRSAIALVPEIALTPQLAGRFRARFGDDVAVLHSGLSERERLGEWHRVRDGRAGIVVGARSAIWAPVARLGIVVVDEEHEPSYKQEDRLRYNARDLALVRAQRARAVAVLGSATPSLETLRRAQEGKLSTLRLPERVDGRALPGITIVRRPVSGRLFTQPLAAALAETLGRGEQSILFLNRRGHSRTLLCAACGAAVGCPNCSVALVLHRAQREELRCHLCGHREPPRAACVSCSGRKLVALGGGTEKVEEELRALLPLARVARLDRDAAGGPGEAAAILVRFARRELDVLVGTQMVAKGHDFPGVTLVGVLDADGPLHLPDFRAAERCVQLLSQVAGRAGRGTLPGRVVVQAFRPDEPAIAASSDYASFATAELERRAALGFPPFVRLAAVRLQGNVEGRVKGAAERLAAVARRAIEQGLPASVLGPAPAPLARLRGKHRYQLLLRARDHGPLHALGRALAEAHDQAGPGGVELSVDIDPAALL